MHVRKGQRRQARRDGAQQRDTPLIEMEHGGEHDAQTDTDERRRHAGTRTFEHPQQRKDPDADGQRRPVGQANFDRKSAITAKKPPDSSWKPNSRPSCPTMMLIAMPFR